MLEYRVPFIKSLSTRFIESGTRCVAVIDAPTPSLISANRAKGSIVTEANEIGLQVPDGLRARTECVRFRSTGPLLLNHILVVPNGASMMNGTILGKTNPYPAQCHLEAWASNCLPALLSPDDNEAQLRETLLASGQYYPLQKSSGSIPDSIVLVPQLAPVGPNDQGHNEFPTLMLTESIIVRGIYEHLTLCIFGTEIPNGPRIAAAAKSLWTRHIPPHRPSDIAAALTHFNPESIQIDDDDLVNLNSLPTDFHAAAFLESFVAETLATDTEAEDVVEDTQLEYDGGGVAEFMLTISNFKKDGGISFAAAFESFGLKKGEVRSVDVLLDVLSWIMNPEIEESQMMSSGRPIYPNSAASAYILEMFNSKLPDQVIRDNAGIICDCVVKGLANDTIVFRRVKLGCLRLLTTIVGVCPEIADTIEDGICQLAEEVALQPAKYWARESQVALNGFLAILAFNKSLKNCASADDVKLNLERVLHLPALSILWCPQDYQILATDRHVLPLTVARLLVHHQALSRLADQDLAFVANLVVNWRNCPITIPILRSLASKTQSSTVPLLLLGLLVRDKTSLPRTMLSLSVLDEGRVAISLALASNLKFRNEVFRSLAKPLEKGIIILGALYNTLETTSEVVHANMRVVLTTNAIYLAQLQEAIHNPEFFDATEFLSTKPADMATRFQKYLTALADPQMGLSLTQDILNSQELALSTESSPAIWRSANIIKSFDLARRANSYNVILGGYDASTSLSLPVPAPIGQCVSTFDLVLVINTLTQWKHKFEWTLSMSKRMLLLDWIHSWEALSKLYSVTLGKQNLASLLAFCVDSLIWVARDLVQSDLDQVKEVQKPQNTELFKILAQESLSVIRLIFIDIVEESSMGSSAKRFGVLNSSRRINPSLYRALIVLMELCWRSHPRIVNDSLHLLKSWYDRSDTCTQRWIIRETLAHCRGTPILYILSITIIQILGQHVFDFLRKDRSGLSFSVVKASHRPPILPLHLSSFSVSALEATIDTALFSTVVTLSLSTAIDRLVSEEEEEEERDSSNVYICCHIPSQNFVSTDELHIAPTGFTDTPFSLPIFAADDIVPKGEEPSWDSVYEKLIAKLREQMTIEQWALYKQTSIQLDTLIEFVSVNTTTIGQTNSVDILMRLASIVPMFTAVEFPWLSIIAERISVLASSAKLTSAINELTQTLLFISATPDLMPKQPDWIWCTSVLRSIAQGLQNIRSDAPILPLLKAASRIFRSILTTIRKSRPSTTVFVLLSQTRKILSGITSNVHLVTPTPDLVSEVFTLLTECIYCPFICHLMAFDMTDPILDGVSQCVFSDDSPDPAKTFEAAISACVDIRSIIAWMVEDPNPPDPNLIKQLGNIISGLNEKLTTLPEYFILNMFLNPSAEANIYADGMDLLADSCGETSRNNRILDTLTSHFGKMEAWSELLSILTKIPRCPKLDTKIEVQAVALWEAPGTFEPVELTLDYKNLQTIFTEHLKTKSQSHEEFIPKIDEEGDQSWLNNPVSIRRLGDDPLRNQTAEQLPLRIEMESAEEQESMPQPGDLSRQKRSLSAKAARYANTESMTPAEPIPVTPLLTVTPQPFGVAGTSIMDDWGAFTTATQSTMMPPVVTMELPPPALSYESYPPQYDDDGLSQFMAIPEFRDFLESGDRMGVNVREIFKNPSLLQNPEWKQPFLTLVATNPAIAGLFQSMGVMIE